MITIEAEKHGGSTSMIRRAEHDESGYPSLYSYVRRRCVNMNNSLAQTYVPIHLKNYTTNQVNLLFLVPECETFHRRLP